MAGAILVVAPLSYTSFNHLLRNFCNGSYKPSLCLLLFRQAVAFLSLFILSWHTNQAVILYCIGLAELSKTNTRVYPKGERRAWKT